MAKALTKLLCRLNYIRIKDYFVSRSSNLPTAKMNFRLFLSFANVRENIMPKQKSWKEIKIYSRERNAKNYASRKAESSLLRLGGLEKALKALEPGWK